MFDTQDTTALVPIREHEGRQAVSGRELHAFLQVGTRYNDWFSRMAEYGFVDGEDFHSFLSKTPEGGRPSVDHALTIDMAKELSMLQRTERGKEARRYFIEVEKRYNQQSVPALPDLSTPEGVLALAQTLTKTAEELVAAKSEVAELTPLAAQARTHNLGKGNAGKQAFAREIIKWALAEGFQVKQPQVIEFISRKLDMFVVGNRSDHGDATISGERRGLSTTVKGTSEHNGHAYSQGLLTPKGVEYAWSRIESYVREHGHLELPKKGIAA